MKGLAPAAPVAPAPAKPNPFAKKPAAPVPPAAAPAVPAAPAPGGGSALDELAKRKGWKKPVAAAPAAPAAPAPAANEDLSGSNDLSPAELGAEAIVEALILLATGFLPGLGLTALLYHLTRVKAALPIYMSFNIVATVFVLSLFMCVAAGVLALRRLRSADPADVF